MPSATYTLERFIADVDRITVAEESPKYLNW